MSRQPLCSEAQHTARCRAVRRSTDLQQASRKLFHGLFRRVAKATMYRRNLDDGASRRDQPVEPLALAEPRDGTTRSLSRADLRDRLQMLPHQLDIYIRP